MPVSLLLAFLAIAMVAIPAAAAPMTLVRNGKPHYVIVTQPGAIAPEQTAAKELQLWLSRVTGVEAPIVESSRRPDGPCIVVGPGPVADGLFPGAMSPAPAPEETVRMCDGKNLLLAGGRPRGTLYAVMRFLQKEVGMRWWAPWATHVPNRRTLTVASGSKRESPAFEYRHPFWYPAFDPVWAMRHAANGFNIPLTEEQGGRVDYRGFVHTFETLVPASKHFESHPEWYSLIDGKRTHVHAQLCTTNPELRDFMVERVREVLAPPHQGVIASVSQNDCFNPCQCPNCKAVDDAEGSHAGTMIQLVNYIAERIADEQPLAAIDTLAYQYTRKAPKTIRPRPNVIVRLCSIECSFSQPLSAPVNASFAQDIRDWNRLTDRLYIWDYTTNFGHYAGPHPNYFVLGPNVRFFHQHGVKGLFEQGAYQGFGAEMAELRGWLLAQLMWDPNQDDRKLIDEFLKGYYGPAAAPIGQYLKMMAQKASTVHLSCFSPMNGPHLRLDTLTKALALFDRAEKAVAGDPDLRWRVRQARLPVWYAFLQRWGALRRERRASNVAWPVPESRAELARMWLADVTAPGPEGSQPMTHVNEGGLTPAAFADSVMYDPKDLPARPEDLNPPKRLSRVPLPDGLPNNGRGAIDLQDNRARDINAWMERRGDLQASDHWAACLMGDHHEWGFQMGIDNTPKQAQSGRWDVWISVRIDSDQPIAPDAVIATAGVWDGNGGAQINAQIRASQVSDKQYRLIRLGTAETRTSQYIWAAPQPAKGLVALWVDRVILVPADGAQ